MDINSFFQSKKFKWTLITIGALVILLVVFNLGFYVGLRKANFSYRWGENYHQAFGGPQKGFIQDFQGKDFISGHGTVGAVIKIESDLIIVKGPKDAEKTISFNNQTIINRGQNTIKTTEIKIDDRVVIIGSPKDDGTIEAKFIRVFDPAADPLPPPPPPNIDHLRF